MAIEVEIKPLAVAREMQLEWEFGMDVLAELAASRLAVGIAHGYNGTDRHKSVPAFLRKLADEIEACAEVIDWPATGTDDE